MSEDRLFCITVKVKPEDAQLDIVIEEDLSVENLIAKIEVGLSQEYRRLNDVSAWCFHDGEHNLQPGDFVRCHAVRLEAWLKRQAAKEFGWPVPAQ